MTDDHKLDVFRIESICVEDNNEDGTTEHTHGRNGVHKIEWVDPDWISVWGQYRDQTRGDSDCVHAHPTRKLYHVSRVVWVSEIAEGGYHRCCGMEKVHRGK